MKKIHVVFYITFFLGLLFSQKDLYSFLFNETQSHVIFLVSNIICCALLAFLVQSFVVYLKIYMPNDHSLSKCYKSGLCFFRYICVSILTCALLVMYLVVQNKYISNMTNIRIIQMIVLSIVIMIGSFFLIFKNGQVTCINNCHVIYYRGRCRKIVQYQKEGACIFLYLENFYSKKNVKTKILVKSDDHMHEIMTSFYDKELLGFCCN